MTKNLLYYSMLCAVCALLLNACSNSNHENKDFHPADAVQFSQGFLLSMKNSEDYEPYLDTLRKLDQQQLKEELSSKEIQLTFWINLYNSLVQVQLKKDKILFENKQDFFTTRSFDIGGTALSLNDIENGILRRKSIKGKNRFIQKFQVTKVDPRIHFALNCGANACPPIAFYDPTEIDEQLEVAEAVFITNTSNFRKEKNQLELSELFKWYASDFGGEEKILELLKKHQVIPLFAHPEIIYTPYDWGLDDSNFAP